jgi:hypothetical protein
VPVKKASPAWYGWLAALAIGAFLGLLAGLLTLIAITAAGLPTLLSAVPALVPQSAPSPTSLPSPTLQPSTETSLPSPSPSPTITPTPLPPEGEAFSIGQSVQGRELLVVRFGSGPIVRMIVGGIHGGYEANTVILSQLLIEDLRTGRLVVPPELTLYILPNMNPDGYYNHLNSSYGRANANGVDLNRNFDSYWVADWPRTGCFNYVAITAGPHPFSEPEARALRDFLLANRVDALIAYHSQMGAIFSHGSVPLHPAGDDLARTLAQASGYLYPPPDTGCLYTGQLVDWSLENDILALTVELTTHESTDIEINRRMFEAFLAWRRP